MVLKFRFLLTAVIPLVIVFVSCSHTKSQRELIVYPKIAPGSKVYVTQMPFGDEQPVIVDSVIAQKSTEPVKLVLPGSEDRLYSISTDFNNYTVSFISDTKSTTIVIDCFDRTYKVKHSAATVSLDAFNKKQSELYVAITKAKHAIDSMKAAGRDVKLYSNKVTQLQETYASNFIGYADTVHSPAAFIIAYNNIEFGKDLTGLKQFFTRANKRFPDYKPLKQLNKKVNRYLSIMENEYKVGEKLPLITLPDTLDQAFTTASLKGKYYFIDLWATWCPPCIQYNEVKQKAYQLYGKGNFEMVSVALEADVTDWRTYLRNNKLTWTQLIDKQVWDGITLNTFKADSIPFNFLVSPDGKIIDKAIKVDSLLPVLSRLKIKRQK